MKYKKPMKRRAAVLLTALALIAADTPRCSASCSGGAIVADVFLARPFCLVATILGSAAFVVALPIAATSKSVCCAAQALVVRPAQATFTRPLGDFDDLSADGDWNDD